MTGVRRIGLWAASTVTVVVLMLGYHTSTAGSGVGSADGTTRPAAVSGGTVASGTDGSGSAGGTTVTGDAAQTRYGPVQVEVTMDGSTIAGVDVVQYPSGNPRDQQINGYALPQLVQETLAAQSAQIDMVSGATYTSEGYLVSLQSALDRA